MNSALRVLVIWSVVLVARSTFVQKECLFTTRWTGTWSSSSVALTAWLPEEEEASLLSVILASDTKPSAFYLIEFWRSNVTIQFINGIDSGNGTKFTKYGEELRIGWAYFNVSHLSTGLEVWYMSYWKLLSLNDTFGYNNVTIEGKYITVNCNQDLMGWSLAENGDSAIVPLPMNKMQHAIFMYSETVTRPSLSFPPDSKYLHIAWNGTSLYGNTSLMLADHKDPLSPYVLYNLSVSCKAWEDKVECAVLTEGGSVCLETMEFEAMPRNLKISAPSVHKLFVFIPHVTSILDELIFAEQQGSSVERVKVSTVVVIVILTLVFLGIILLVLISSILRSRAIKDQKRRQSIIASVLPDEAEPLMRYHDSPVPLPRGSIILEEQNLWEAVREGDVDTVKSLLEEGHLPDEVEFNRFTTPYMDAHMLGSKEVVQVFSEFKGEKYTTAPDDLIKTVLYELERNMKEIFLAAECGMYGHDGGVESLLKAYNLPGTITDVHGRSIIHYMASVTLMDGIPVWQSKDIGKFFANHEPYINAVDHWGRTALHELSQHLQAVEVDVIWDGKEWNLPDAWLALARLLVSYGCDPRIPDHKGQLAHELAQAAGNYELAKYLEQKCSELGHINIEKATDHFHSLVSAVRQGNTQQMRDLLLRHVPLMPLSAKSDLLVEAILSLNRNALLLLLAAGAPLCNRTIGDVTPLEVAHNTFGLPACFPALIRKAYYERLENEISRVPSDNEALAPLRQSMTAYNLQVMDVGSKAKWIFSVKEHTARCQEARHLLVQAAELGLSFTCQLLGLEDLYLHSLPDEPNTFHRAMINKHQHTQMVLYRDLGMSPFTFSSSAEVLYWQLLEKLWVNEMKALEALCQRESKRDERFKIKSILTRLKKLRSECVWDQEDEAEEAVEFLLYILARHGLITILHAVLSQCPELHPDKIVFSSYRCTMLHVAAAFGKMNIIEYLMHIGATLDSQCIGNYTPAHIAAISGYKKCFEYILDYMKSVKADISKRSHVKLTASEVMAKYEKLCDNSGLPLLGHENALFIKNERDEHAQTYEILKRRGSILKINIPADLLRIAKTNLCKKPYTEEIEQLISGEMKHLGNLITESGYQGTFIPVGACSEGNEVLCVQNINYIFEVSDFGTNEDLNYQDDEKEEKITIVIESKPENSLYIADAYIRSFVQRLKTLLSQYEPSTSKLSFAPPFVDCVSDGACMYWIVNYEHGIRFIQTFIKPVIPVTCPSDDINDTLPPEVSKYVVAESDVQLHLINEFGEWTYCASIIEKFVFQELNKNQRTVWITCRLLVRLLRSTWWAPRFDVHYQNKSWHTLSVGIESLTERGLKSLFLQELAESQDWSAQHLFERVVSVFSRACKRDLRGKWTAREYVNSFLTPRHFCCNVGTSVCGIMQYLEELSKAAPQIPDKTVKFVVP